MPHLTERPWTPVIYGDRCRGFVACRRNGFEAFDIDEQSLGTFKTETEAVAALFRKGGANNK